jgi:nitrite reductase/ring-hydroxylating ferredoxin subunit
MKQKLLLILIINLLACKKEEGRIPVVNVDYYLYISDPKYVNLNAVGGWVYINGGSRGILVYHSSPDEFMAYDRHCTFEVENSCGQVKVEPDNVSLKDSCCGSTFLIMDGSVTNGPAQVPLKRYTTYFDGSQLRIYN